MSPETKREFGLQKVGPGLYSLPDERRAKPIRLSEEYKQYTERMRARINPITYFRVLLKQAGIIK